MHNPYQSPSSLAPDLRPAPGKRPLSIWLLLLVLGALALLFAVNTAAIIWFVFSYGAGLPVSFLPDVGWRLALLAAGLGALFGILRRRQWARWLAVLGMTALTAALFFIPDTAHYANDAERLATATGGTIVAPALMGWWIYAFGFSSKAKRYFAD